MERSIDTPGAGHWPPNTLQHYDDARADATIPLLSLDEIRLNTRRFTP